MMNEIEMGGSREETDPQSDPHNEVAKFITEAEENGLLDNALIAEARNILGEIGSETEDAPAEKIERLREILSEVDPERTEEILVNLF